MTARRGAVRWIVLGVGVAWGAGARAAPGPASTVTLDASGCSSVGEGAIREAVGVELGDLLASGTGGARADHLAVRCAQDVAWLEAHGVGGAAPIRRTLRLADFPDDAAPRAVALAGVEMLAALSPAVRARVEVQRGAAPPPVAALPAARGMRLGLAAVRRDFFAPEGFGGWGGRVAVERPLGSGRFGVALDLEVDGARRDVALGATSAWLASLGGFATLRAAGARAGAALAIGARGGAARLEGTPAAGAGALGGVVLRPWWGPALAAAVWAGGRRLVAVAGLEAGIVARGATGLADGATVLAVDGPWLAVSLGLGF